MPTNSHADMRDADAARRPMAPQMPYLPPPIGGSEHGGRGTECICVIYIFSGVALRWRPSGACLLLGGASVAVPASDWTERHRSRIAASCCPIPPTRGTCPFGGSSLGHLVEWGLPAVCTWCVWLSDPPCHMMIIIYHHHTFIITHDRAESATDYGE